MATTRAARQGGPQRGFSAARYATGKHRQVPLSISRRRVKPSPIEPPDGAPAPPGGPFPVRAFLHSRRSAVAAPTTALFEALRETNAQEDFMRLSGDGRL